MMSVRIFAARLISCHQIFFVRTFSIRSRMSSISRENRYRPAMVIKSLKCRHCSHSRMIHEKTTSRGSYIYDSVDHFDVIESQIRIRLASRPPILGAIGCPTDPIPLAPLVRGDRRREKRRTEKLNVLAWAQSPPYQGGFRGIGAMQSPMPDRFSPRFQR